MKCVAKAGSIYFHGRFYVTGEEIPATLDEVKSLIADGIVEVVEEAVHEPEPAPVVAKAPDAVAKEPTAKKKAEATPPPVKAEKPSAPEKKTAQRKPRANKS